jgi:6-phosphogluconolactonase
MFARKSVLKLFCIFSTLAAFALLGFVTVAPVAAQSTGNVYVLSNSEENAVIVFHRNADGTISQTGRFVTGGSGSGEGANPLGSQGPVILSADNRMLFAVNAGSNSISVFSVSGDELNRLQTISSGGTRPIGLTASHDLLYVLNTGDSPNITGFRIVPGDSPLVALDGSTQSLTNGSAAQPAEVIFNREGNVLLVTEKGTNQIDSFMLNEAGQAQAAEPWPATGSVPFGCAFSRNNIAVLAYTADAAPEAGGVGSYRVTTEGNMIPIGSEVSNGQTASTWMAVTGNGALAFTTNTVSGTISSFAVSPESGNVTLSQPVAATLRGGEESRTLFPSDMALSNSSRYLYVRNGANGTVTGFAVHSDGTLTPVAHAEGLPENAAGIAAR